MPVVAKGHFKNANAISMPEYLGLVPPKPKTYETYIEQPLDEDDYGLGYFYRGFFCKLDRVHAAWAIDPEKSEVKPLPAIMQGHFTDRETMKRVINNYLDNGNK